MRLPLDKYNNLTQRIITALIGALVLVLASYFSEWSYFVVFFLICCLTILEFYTLAGLDGMLPLKFFGTINALLIFTLSFLIESEILGNKYYFVIFPMLALIFLIKLYKMNRLGGDKLISSRISFCLCPQWLTEGYAAREVHVYQASDKSILPCRP